MFGNNLKYCREELEITQRKLGQILGVSEKTISGWETAQDTIPFRTLIKFCNLYNYSVDFVVGLIRQNIKYNQNIDITNKIIGGKLKTLRSDLKLSQQKLADECGFSRSTYSRFETGHDLINTITAYTLCKKYNISMDWLCNIRQNKYLK